MIKKLQNNPGGHKPSRTWLYDAVNLAIDYKLFEAKQLESAYGLLGHSLKVNLTYAPHDNIEFKNKLIKEAVDNKYTVAQLREKIFEEKRKNDVNYISLDENLDEDKLRTFDKDKLQKIQKETEALKKALEDKLITYNNNLDYIKRSLNIKTTGYPNKYKSNF